MYSENESHPLRSEKPANLLEPMWAAKKIEDPVNYRNPNPRCDRSWVTSGLRGMNLGLAGDGMDVPAEVGMVASWWPDVRHLALGGACEWLGDAFWDMSG